MSFKLDLPAPRVPMFAADGTINPPWYRFFVAISKRLGVSTQNLIESSQTEAEAALAVANQAIQLANSADAKADQAITDASNAQTTANSATSLANQALNNRATHFYGSTTPTANNDYDAWFDTTSGIVLKVWDGTTWQTV